MISGKAKIAGIIGWPVAHSLSPRLHNYWLDRYGIDGVYVPFPVKPEDLADILKSLPKMGFSGANLTLPHKEMVMPMLDYADDNARLIGAANTIVVDGAKLRGMNTDSYGFAENIRPHLPQRKNKAIVLGAGGAARAVCAALKHLGFLQVTIANRDRSKANLLAETFSIIPAPWENRSRLLEDADLLVNATSLGMQGKEALSIDLTALPEQALVTDIVYAPLITPLLEQARLRGNPIVDGLGMLLHQAVPGFEAWFGVTPEVTPQLRQYLIS